MATGLPILSASRRTDIPACHARWFRERFRAGFCHWVHPYTGEVRRVSLAPDAVAGIVFWTRNPAPFLTCLEEIRAAGVPAVFHFTLTGYGPPLETHNPPVERAVAAWEELARLLGPEAVTWRYDPILLSRELTPDVHLERFARLAARLRGLTERCVFSFVDFYGKTVRRLRPIEASQGFPFARPGEEEKKTLLRSLARLAREHGMRTYSCCDDSLVGGGIEKARCVDPDLIARVRGEPLTGVRFRPTRKDCGCAQSIDIGAYDTCSLCCAYCYAVSSREAALARISHLDPQDSFLWRPRSRGPEAGGAPAGGGTGERVKKT
jgi:hypothetical protein